MSTDYAQRRAELAERLDRDRDAVAEAFTALEGRLGIASTMVSAVRTAGRHKALTGVLALAAIFAPLAARSWLKRAAWWLPLAIQVIRIVRNTRRDREAD